MAKGAVLRHLIDSCKPTLILLTETKRKRKDIPDLLNYSSLSQDPLDGSSGGIVFYYKDQLCFRISIVSNSTCNSILWIHLRHHQSATKDLYICGLYAPTANSSDKKKISFYNELNRTTSEFQSLPGYCILVGDFNARIGVISGDHATNTNMGPFLEFLDDHPPLTNMNVLKTYGQYTFFNISNGHSSIIDYMLTDMHASKITEHIVLSGNLGTSAQTAHKAILSKIMLTVKEEDYTRPKKNPKWRRVTVKNIEHYCKTLNNELSKITDQLVSYKSLIAAINRSKTNSLGRMRPRPPSSTNTTPEIDRLNMALGAALEKHRINPTQVNLLMAQTLENDLRKIKNAYETKSLLDLICRLEGLHQTQKMRLFYRKVKERTKPRTNPTFVIRNPDSPIKHPIFSTTKKEFINFWTRYLEKTFERPSNQFTKETWDSSQPLVQLHLNKPSPHSSLDKPLTKAEVCMAIKSLKGMKAAGLDEITNEDIKLIENIRPGLIHTILLKLWEEEICPLEFRRSLLHLISKPGKPGKRRDLRLQTNYRPIALLSSFRKLYEVILSSRILTHVSLNQSQFGFLPGRSTSDCIFILVEAILQARYNTRGPRDGTNQRLYTAFLDFKGAFDNVPRERIWQKMYDRFCIRGKLLRVIIDLYKDTTGLAIVNELYTRKFSIFSGVLQGSVLGPTLFLLFLDDLLEELHKSRIGISIGGFILSVIAYADDVTLLSLKASNLQRLLNICNFWAKRNGMTFALDKCYAVVFNSRTKKPEALPTFLFGGTNTSPNQLVTYYPEEAPDLYLGIKITDHVARTKISSTQTLPKSVVPHYRRKPNSAYLKLIKSKFMQARRGICHLCSNEAILTPSISTRLYKTLQRSTLLYAIEFVDWDVDEVKELEILQAKALRTCLNSDLQCPQPLLRIFCGVEPIEARRDLHTLLYYAKLCNQEPASFPNMVHRARTSYSGLPVGFHSTVLHILKKYDFEKYWDHVPDVPHSELKAIFKKPIWQYHWDKDIASARSRDAPFSSTMHINSHPPTNPYKSYHFINSFMAIDLSRANLSSILRFWMTPSRLRICSCTLPTVNIAKHLIFECSKTRSLVASYQAKLSPMLRSILQPGSLPLFFSRVMNNDKDLGSFNRLVAEFFYPRF